MKTIKKHGKTIGLFTIIILLLSFIFSLFNLGGLMSFNTTSILFIILMML